MFELLGKGAFGSVYKVCRKSAGQTFLAMKEVSILGQGHKELSQKFKVMVMMN